MPGTQPASRRAPVKVAASFPVTPGHQRHVPTGGPRRLRACARVPRGGLRGAVVLASISGAGGCTQADDTGTLTLHAICWSGRRFVGLRKQRPSTAGFSDQCAGLPPRWSMSRYDRFGLVMVVEPRRQPHRPGSRRHLLPTSGAVMGRAAQPTPGRASTAASAARFFVCLQPRKRKYIRDRRTSCGDGLRSRADGTRPAHEDHRSAALRNGVRRRCLC